ncbi:MAG: hypothetical protein JRI48_08420 [Deltaproteobacteria bacterium]|nr:hypothetical protein [Deltaproteobacteria bacterium]
MIQNQENRGGKREGSGRKPLSNDTHWLRGTKTRTPKKREKRLTPKLAEFIEKGKKEYTKAEIKKIQKQNREDAKKIINRLKAQGVEI